MIVRLVRLDGNISSKLKAQGSKLVKMAWFFLAF
jgi:hypothetical protein